LGPVNTAKPHKNTHDLTCLLCSSATQAFIDKFRYNAKRASLVQSRIKALERMAEVQVRALEGMGGESLAGCMHGLMNGWMVGRHSGAGR
jgi:hypothetical protein